MYAYIFKAVLKRLYQHHNFFKLSMSSRGKTMLTYKLDRGSLQRVIVGLRTYTVAVTAACVLQVQYQRTNKMCEKAKRHDIIFYNY